jgi:hypothetical protein
MNENIQKLYSKVLNESAERWNHPDAEKFARLIILECADVAGDDWDTAGRAILKHFGVER